MGKVERPKAEAQQEIKDGLAGISSAIDSVREDGWPLRARQLELYVELVKSAKEYLEGYLHYLEIDGTEFWWETHNPSEPEYAGF